MNVWPMKKVLASNKHKVPEHDVYGRLYFYIVDKMRAFVDLAQSGKLKITLSSEDPLKLLREFRG